MMLHEAVMLEIYRQALSASELASPRCQSRESSHSNVPGDARCPSNGSHCSGNEHLTPIGTPIPASPPVGLPLSATLPPAAAAALLPPQSAAVAAYLNAAAAAAQQNHLLLTNPLAAAASLVQQAAAQQAHSPNMNAKATPSASPVILDTTPALDFSRRSAGRRGSESGGSMGDEEGADESDLRKKLTNENDCSNDGNPAEDGEPNAPLDLSLGSSRKRQADDNEMAIRKTPRPSDYKSIAPGSTWVPPINPYLVAVAAASLSPKTPMSLDWSSAAAKQKFSPNEATKALEKMTEMTRLGSATESSDTHQPHHNSQRSHSSSNSSSSNNHSGGSGGRHSAWQSHWLTKGADAVKDVFKCVWCKQSFPTLASLTVHMKETQHCGVNIPPTGGSSGGAASGHHHQAGAISASSHHHGSRHPTTQTASSSSSSSCSSSSSLSASAAPNTANAASSAGSERKSDLNLLIKETMPLPRKLVRGQDVWLGKGAEQTRQILKCMWCGQSFRSLAEMTTHMQETQHYTNIISQEQIISWKSSDDKNPNAAAGAMNHAGNNSNAAGAATAGNGGNPANGPAAMPSAASQANHAVSSNATVSAVLTCKVCDQAFPTLKDLSTHMAKNAHYKEHLMRSGPTPAEATNQNSQAAAKRGGGGRQSGGRGEKRKKSLPVRKLLELERAQQDYKNSNSSLDSALKPLRDFAASTKITCEKCGEKIETALFVEHIRLCLGGHIPISPRNHNNNSISSLKFAFEEQQRSQQQQRVQTPSNHSDGRQTADNTAADRNNISPMSSTTNNSEILCPLPKEGEKPATAPSVLNAIEQLIEKSFDTRTTRSGNSSSIGSKPNTPLGSSILKRLGIDDNVDYTKPLMDPQTLQFLRSYSSYASRERSASESSSTSERCNSRLESMTPERSSSIHSRQPTPHHMSPDKAAGFANGNGNGSESNRSPAPSEGQNTADTPKIKTEPMAEGEEEEQPNEPVEQEKPEAGKHRQKISVKKEFTMPQDDDDDKPLARLSRKASPTPRALSPSLSDRSITPKSTSSSHCGNLDKKPAPPSSAGSSLNALSSMFDNLNSIHSHSNFNANNKPLISGETNNNHNTSGKKSSANPLAALQKLCETTAETPPSANTRSSSANPAASNGPAGAVGSGMVAFSWACNDAVMTSADSIIKCSFCDTPFCSKGAYRHHLSKVHFVKDTNDSNSGDVHSLKSSPGLATSPKSALNSPKRCNSKSPTVQRPSLSPPTAAVTKATAASVTPIINPYEESPQSKFLKYTELAKQLSSKNA